MKLSAKAKCNSFLCCFVFVPSLKRLLSKEQRNRRRDGDTWLTLFSGSFLFCFYCIIYFPSLRVCKPEYVVSQQKSFCFVCLLFVVRSFRFVFGFRILSVPLLWLFCCCWLSYGVPSSLLSTGCKKREGESFGELKVRSNCVSVLENGWQWKKAKRYLCVSNAQRPRREYFLVMWFVVPPSVLFLYWCVPFLCSVVL